MQRDSLAESIGIECKKQEQRRTHELADKSTGFAYLHCDGHDMAYSLRARNGSSSRRMMRTQFERDLSFCEDTRCETLDSPTETIMITMRVYFFLAEHVSKAIAAAQIWSKRRTPAQPHIITPIIPNSVDPYLRD